MGNWPEQAGKLRLVLAVAAGQNLPQSLQETTGYSLVPQGGGAENLCVPLAPPDPPALTPTVSSIFH